ncbi:MAG TPA: hypothetical protein VFK79_02960 [Xanthobacteraceae bacterium]|nr:hypothetical protein [Xanthobacteraceae bacterium]
MVTSYIGPEPDFFFMKTLFGFDTPSTIINYFFYSVAPAAVQGVISGIIAMLATLKLYKGSQLETVAYASAALWTGAMLMLFVGAMMLAGWRYNYLESFAQIIGLWFGIQGGLQSAPSSSLRYQ